MCVLLCEHGITCALRWIVALVGVILTGHCSSRRGTPFQVQVSTDGRSSDEAVIAKKVDMWP